MVTPYSYQITRWAAYPSSQVLSRVCRGPFRPLQFDQQLLLCTIIICYTYLYVKFFQPSILDTVSEFGVCDCMQSGDI